MSLGTNYFINLHVKNEYYDVDKLIGFLDHHEVIPNSVFASCDRQFRGVDYHSHLLDTKKGYEPVDRSHFLARIPFYFYIDENPKNNCVKEPLELGTLISACIAEGYTITRMYFVLDRMFELGIKVRHIFSYYVMQAGEVSAKMFFMWYSYIEKAQNFGIEELMPERLITAYNEEVGVRIRTSRDFYSVTEEEAIERVMISENIKNGTLSKEMIEDTSDADMIRQMLFSINLLKNEYKILECHIHGLSMANKEILLPYVNKKTNLERLSKKLCIEPDSVKQRIYRIKKQLKETVFLYMKDYEEGDF